MLILVFQHMFRFVYRWPIKHAGVFHEKHRHVHDPRKIKWIYLRELRAIQRGCGIP